MKRLQTQANALLVTLGLLASVAAVLGITLSVTASTTRITARSRDYAVARAAAEGAVEYAYGIWLRRIRTGPISTAVANANLTPPPFPGITYAKEGPQLSIVALDEYGVSGTNASSLPPQINGRVPGYEGWSGRTLTYAAQARVQLDDKTVVGVRRLFQYTEVPLFQSMFFFQHDLEFYCPAPMVINGLIHSNGTLFLAPNTTDSLVIQGNATYSTGVSKYPPGAKYWSSYRGDNWEPPEPTWSLGKTAQLNQVPPIQPMGGAPDQVFDPDNPNADDFHQIIDLPDPNYPDPEEISRRRMVNKASVVVKISGTNITLTAQHGAVISDPTALKQAFSKTIARDEQKVVTSTTNYRGVVTTTTTTIPAVGIYDQRERKRVDTVEVDVGKLKTALSKVGDFNNVIYIYDATPVTPSEPNPKALRLVNGSVLPDNGLTIASKNPVYIQGDYNTGGKGTSVPSNGKNSNANSAPTVSGYTRKPSAVIADAVMFLSNSWNDANSHKALSNRVATNTTYNTAILAGFMPSEIPGKDGATVGNYSGGANNFPRFLENWQNIYCTYYGSMVELFKSKTFTGRWDTGNIFSPPNRRWSFDTNFLTTPPPGSVEAVVLTRGPWSTF